MYRRLLYVLILCLCLAPFASFTAAPAGAQTCKGDQDCDGVPDAADQCPNVAGPRTNGGCPVVVPTATPRHPPGDTDGDGTPDTVDQCPLAGGPDWNNGCPTDRNSPASPTPRVVQPQLPTTGPCVAATRGTERVNIRQEPGQNSTIAAQLPPTDTANVTGKIDTPEGPYYRLPQGWSLGTVLRFGGDCTEVENPPTTPPCDGSLTAAGQSCEVPPQPTCPATTHMADVNGNGTGDVATGSAAGSADNVHVMDGDGSDIYSFMAYAADFTGGVNVALGDINGDGRADIVTGAGPGSAPQVKVFDGATGNELSSFMAYDASFTGGVFVGTGDVTGDGLADIVTGAGPGSAPQVKVFDGATGNELSSFMAYDASFTGGVRVAAGDINNDGRADIITGAGPGAAPHVKAFDGASETEIRSFFAYDATFTGGVFVAAGDINGDCQVDIITGAGAGAGPHVKAFDGMTLDTLVSFFAFDSNFTGGVMVAASDVNGDGRDDIVATVEMDLAPHTKAFDGLSLAVLFNQ